MMVALVVWWVRCVGLFVHRIGRVLAGGSDGALRRAWIDCSDIVVDNMVLYCCRLRVCKCVVRSWYVHGVG